ncbi:sodium:calcium antiporter [Lysobacter pythonis]|uniref:Sodium:calcium antiporter n=1 Tax=Solilutibacter pythonis TaxID=2483112 RepID=A0A3M2I127_9GAMM|nr:calcium/sodium antiporter [Lysobacter pythonis]RMH92872.1 sodium:calcium antiporter [Lysobacter pythonis]
MTPILLFLGGLVALLGGAELLVRGASRLALALGLTPLVVGLTVVSIGTSAPELAIGLGAALEGAPDLAMGNIVGSNIANVLLILGLVALVAPLFVDRQLVWLDVPILVAVSFLCLWMAGDGRIARWEGGVLVAGAAAYVGFLVHLARRKPEETHQPEPRRAAAPTHTAGQLAMMIAGLALLVLGARWLVDAATRVAHTLGLSDLVIGLTVVAIGTSLPEIATSVLSALRGQRDLAAGNLIGSNLFNLLLVLGLTALVAHDGVPVSPAVLHFDMWVMAAVAVACLPIFFTGHRIARWEGAVFLGYYAAYTAYLLLDATHHAALDDFTLAMNVIVIPLTALTLAISIGRALKYRHEAGR